MHHNHLCIFIIPVQMPSPKFLTAFGKHHKGSFYRSLFVDGYKFTEAFTFEWRAQNIWSQIWSFDHAKKVLKGQRLGGGKCLTNRGTLFCNNTGAIGMGLSLKSCSMDDSGLVDASRDWRRLAANKPPILVFTIDNPHRDLRGTERRFGLSRTPTSLSGAPELAFLGEVRCVDTDFDAAVAWLLGALQHDVVPLGFDLEYTVFYTKHVPPGRVALLQFCTGPRCLLLRVHNLTTLPQCVVQLLIAPNLLKVGVNINNDLTKLCTDFPQLAPVRGDVRCCDLGNLATEALRCPAQRWSLKTLGIFYIHVYMCVCEHNIHSDVFCA